MLSTFETSFKYKFAERGNSTIYYLSKVPFLGRKIDDKYYRADDLKMTFGIIGLVFKGIQKFLVKGLFLLLFIFLPSYYMDKFIVNVSFKELELQSLIILCFICGSLFNSAIFQEDEESYKMIKIMRMNPQKYYIIQVILKLADNFIFLLPFFIFMKIANPLFLIIELCSCRVIGEYINIILFKKYNFILKKNEVLISLCYLMLPVAGYVPELFRIVFDFEPFVNSLAVLIILFSAAAFSFHEILKYDDYKKISLEMTLKSKLVNKAELKKESNFGSVKMDKVDKELLDTRRFNNKSGYEYLNSIFFYRNNKLVKKLVKIKVIAVTVFFIFMCILSMFFSSQDIDKLFDKIKDLLPCLVFLMYFMSSTERICKAMFYNCDISLLRYGFYKRPEDILANFKSRIKKIFFYNSIHTFAMVIELSFFIVFIGKTSQFFDVMPILISIVSLSYFFTVYSVFMYYILQPYTKDLEVKSPTFNIVNFVMYVLCYGCSRIRITSSYFTVGVIIITTIFIPISFAAIYKFAPKTFRLK